MFRQKFEYHLPCKRCRQEMKGIKSYALRDRHDECGGHAKTDRRLSIAEVDLKNTAPEVYAQ